MFAFHNKQLVNKATGQRSSSLYFYIDSLRMEPDYYLAIFNISLVDKTRTTLQIPINSFGVIIINQLLNTQQDKLVHLESSNGSIQVYQDNTPITQCPIYYSRDNQHKYMLDAINYFTSH